MDSRFRGNDEGMAAEGFVKSHHIYFTLVGARKCYHCVNFLWVSFIMFRDARMARRTWRFL